MSSHIPDDIGVIHESTVDTVVTRLQSGLTLSIVKLSVFLYFYLY